MHLIVVVLFLCAQLLAGCRMTPGMLAGGTGDTKGVIVRVALEIEGQSGFRTQSAMDALHHLRFNLYTPGNATDVRATATAMTPITSPLNLAFAGLADGSYRLAVDAYGSTGDTVPLNAGGTLWSTNVATVTQGIVSYDVGSAFNFATTLQLVPGPKVTVSVTSPFAGAYTATLVSETDGQIVATYETVASTFSVRNLRPGNYAIWLSASNGSGAATPAQRSNVITVVDGAATVSTPFSAALTNASSIGIGSTAPAGDGAAASAALLTDVSDVTTDLAGNVYVIDMRNSRVRMMPVANGLHFGQNMTAHNIYTIAGNGEGGYAGDGGPALQAKFNQPTNLTVDALGNVAVSDLNNHRLRLISAVTGNQFGQPMTAGNVYTVLGDGNAWHGPTNVAGSTSAFAYPSGGVFDHQGNLIVASGNYGIVNMVPALSGIYFNQTMTVGFTYRIGGGGAQAPPFTDEVNAVGANARGSCKLAVDGLGNVYGSLGDDIVRMIPRVAGTYFGKAVTANGIFTIAGNGAGGSYTDGVHARATPLGDPQCLTLDAAGNLFIGSQSGWRVLMVPVASGTYYGRAMTADSVNTIVGGGTSFDDGQPLLTSTLRSLTGLRATADGILIAEGDSGRVRFGPRTSNTFYNRPMTAGALYTVAGGGAPANGATAAQTTFYRPESVTTDRLGNLYMADTRNNRVRMMPVVSGTYFEQSMTANHVYTIAGNGQTTGTASDGVSPTSATMFPTAVAVSAQGDVYISDYENGLVRVVPHANTTLFGQSRTGNRIYTVAGGQPWWMGSGDGGPATSAGVDRPLGLGLDRLGNLYFINSRTDSIRMVPAVAGTYFGQTMAVGNIHTVVGGGGAASPNDGGSPTGTSLRGPRDMAVDAAGNLIFAEPDIQRIRMVPVAAGTHYGLAMAANQLYTVAGNGTEGYGGDNGAATGASFYRMFGIGLDAAGTIYVAETGGRRVRMITPAGKIQTVMGNGETGEAFAAGAATGQPLPAPNDVCVSPSGTLYVITPSRIRVIN
ncbi:MAG: hypothetical protein H7338_11195 [Candidatus Sericytochromatia bacterium]|nr:hypothetical protein [Candidatus Sericytochromatia bacterium]